MTEPIDSSSQDGVVFEKNPVYLEREDEWRKAVDAERGESAVLDPEKIETYLPLLSGHTTTSDPAYTRYSSNAWWYEATGRTVEGLTGIATRVNPQVSIPGGGESDRFLANVTGGNPQTGASEDIHAFWRAFLQRLINPGRAGILVDFPEDLGREVSAEDAERLERRPTMRLYSALQIWDWRLSREKGSGKKRLVHVVLREEESIQVGPGEFEERDQIRVLRMASSIQHPRSGEEVDGEVYVQEVYVPIENQSSSEERWELEEVFVPIVDGEPLRFIPFELRDWSEVPTRPPLMGVIRLNIQHLRNTAAYERALLITAEPQPFVIYERDEEVSAEEDEGVTGQPSSSRSPEKYILGSEVIWEFEGAKEVGMLEYKGQGLQPMEKALEQKERRMAILGARILMPERRQVEARETAEIHRHGEQSALSKIVANAAGAMLEALRFAAPWLRVPSESVEFEPNLDFQPAAMDPAMLVALTRAFQAGVIDIEDVDWNLKRGEIRDPDRDLESVKLRESTELPSDVLDALRTASRAPTEPPPATPGDEDAGDEES